MSKRIKRNNDELKADRPTINEVKFIPRLPISILVENIRSVHNVGSIFRSADGFGAEKIYLSGYTAHPPREDLHKTALGAEDAVLIEQTKQSKSMYEIDWEFPVCFIVGNEVSGVSEELSAMADIHVELHMRGVKQSLNVSVATGVGGYEFSRYYSQYKKSE